MSNDNDNRLKKLLKDTADNTTCHGIGSLWRTGNKYGQFIWLLAIIASVSGCSYLTIQSIVDFSLYHSITQIKINYEESSHFPMITFCPRNLIGNNKTFEKIKSLLNKTDQEMELVSSEDLKSVLITLRNQLNDQQLKELNFNLKDLLLDCLIAGDQCNDTDFVWNYEPVYGMCYTFNSGRDQQGNSKPLRIVNATGPPSGLFLQIADFKDKKSISTDYFESIKSIFLLNYKILNFFHLFFNFSLLFSRFFQIFSTFSHLISILLAFCSVFFNIFKFLYVYNKGALIAIGNQQFQTSLEDPFFISKNAQTYISFYKNDIKKLDHPYNDCLKYLSKLDPLVSQWFLKNNKSYRRSDCVELLHQNKTRQVCGCYVPYMKTFDDNNNNYCNFDKNDCWENVYDSIDFNLLCPLECDSIEYDFFVSTAFAPPSPYSSSSSSSSLIQKYKKYFNLSSIETNADLMNSISSIYTLTIYSKSLEYTEISQVPKYNAANLISSIGGTFGLFLGMSLLSFVEIAELFLHIIKNVGLFKRRRVDINT
jgi:uncharacterized membrane protein YjfL (UPF0719 family)